MTHDDDFELPPVNFDAEDFEEDDFDEFDDDELEVLAQHGDMMVDTGHAIENTHAQIGRRLTPREQAAIGPYIREQGRKEEQLDVRAALDQYYTDNPKKRPSGTQLRREIMAAAIDEANPQDTTAGPPDELPAGASMDQIREHRRARMVWALEQAREAA